MSPRSLTPSQTHALTYLGTAHVLSSTQSTLFIDGRGPSSLTCLSLNQTATRAEYIKLRKWCNVRGLDLPSLPDGTASIESKCVLHERRNELRHLQLTGLALRYIHRVSHGHSTEDVSRRALRLFGLVFSFTFLYENVLSKILRRQRYECAREAGCLAPSSTHTNLKPYIGSPR